MSEAGAQLMAGSASRVWPPVAGPGPGNTISTSGSGRGEVSSVRKIYTSYNIGYMCPFLFLILGFSLFSRTSGALLPVYCLAFLVTVPATKCDSRSWLWLWLRPKKGKPRRTAITRADQNKKRHHYYSKYTELLILECLD